MIAMTATKMTYQRFVALCDTWSEDISRWPQAEQDAAYALAAEDPRASEALLNAAELSLWLEPLSAASPELRTRILDDALQVAGRRGFWSRLWEELGGVRLLAPTLASGLLLALLLLQLDPASPATVEEGDLLSLALLADEEEEYLQ